MSRAAPGQSRSSSRLSSGRILLHEREVSGQCGLIHRVAQTGDELTVWLHGGQYRVDHRPSSDSDTCHDVRGDCSSSCRGPRRLQHHEGAVWCCCSADGDTAAGAGNPGTHLLLDGLVDCHRVFTAACALRRRVPPSNSGRTTPSRARGDASLASERFTPTDPVASAVVLRHAHDERG